MSGLIGPMSELSQLMASGGIDFLGLGKTPVTVQAEGHPVEMNLKTRKAHQLGFVDMLTWLTVQGLKTKCVTINARWNHVQQNTSLLVGVWSLKLKAMLA